MYWLSCNYEVVFDIGNQKIYGLAEESLAATDGLKMRLMTAEKNLNQRDGKIEGLQKRNDALLLESQAYEGQCALLTESNEELSTSNQEIRHKNAVLKLKNTKMQNLLICNNIGVPEDCTFF